MTYRQRCTILFLVDTSIILMAVLCSWFLIFEHINEFIFPIFLSSIAILVSYHVFAVKWKLYKKVWEYASIGELVIILKIVTFSVFIAMLVHQVTLQEIYVRFLCIICLFLISFIGGSRFFW